MPIPMATIVTLKNEENLDTINKNKYKQLMGFSLESEETSLGSKTFGINYSTQRNSI